MAEFKTLYIKKSELKKVLEAFESDNISIGLELDKVKGDKILWVSNGKNGDKRQVVKINN